MQDRDDLWLALFAGFAIALTAAFLFIIFKLYKLHKKEKRQESQKED